MFLIQLHNLNFFAYHGIHDEEKVLGNEYLINVEIEINPAEKVKHLAQTVNYVLVYETIKERMKTPTPLLETLAQDLAALIYELHKDIIQSISISIQKKHPPITAIEGSVVVTYKQQYNS